MLDNLFFLRINYNIFDGEMSERFKVQSWKGCVSKGTGGSNPPLSVFSQALCNCSSPNPVRIGR